MIRFLFSKILRSLFTKGKIYKVLFGKNKGFRFVSVDDLNTDMMLGFHEPNTFEVFDIFIREGMVVADIGANVGYFTNYLSKKVGLTGKVFAFEPIPATFHRLNESVSLNNLNNVFTIPAAVSNLDAPIEMYLSHSHYMASLDPVWAGYDGGISIVNGIRLDSFFKEKGLVPDFIKMDIEGGGVFALEGALEVINMYEPILFLESHTAAEDLAIGKALSLKPYKVFRVGDKKEVKYLDRNYKDEFGIYGTVIGIPESKLEQFGKWHPNSFQQKRLGQR